MSHISYRMDKFLEWAWVGVLTIVAEMVVPFITPIAGYIIFMIAAIMADTVTGIIAAYKQRKPITSKGIWRTLEKIVIAGIAIMLSHGFETLFIPELPLTKGVSAIIAFAELKSNLENYHKITGVDIGSKLLDTVKERILPTQQHSPNQNTHDHENKPDRD
jgi:phage-related holin